MAHGYNDHRADRLNKTELTSLIFIEIEEAIIEISPDMIEAQEMIDKGHMMKTKWDILPSELNLLIAKSYRPTCYNNSREITQKT